MLGDGPRLTGGLRQDLQTTGAVAAGVREVLGALKHQYALTYALRVAPTPSRTLEVSATRADVSLRAPARPPVR